MRTLAGLVISLSTLLPAAAHADKTFNDGTGATVDCKTDPALTINGNSGNYVLKGACTRVDVNGNKNHVTIESVTKLGVMGNDNMVDVVSADALSIPGNNNKLSVKKHTGKLSNAGSGNTINVGTGNSITIGSGSAAPSGSPTAVDCAKDPKYSIANGGGTYTFTGACASISVAGGNNTLTIESVKALAVTGAKNTVTVDATDSIATTGSDNTITYKKGVTGAKPKVSTVGQNNKVTQAK